METENKIKAYKGFNSDMTCRKFQFEVGKEYEQEGKIEACENGFHACENPMDVFGYYPPSSSRYCEVEQSGSIDRGKDKIASSKIRIQCEIGLSGIIQAGVKFILDKVNWKNDNATNTGNQSAATNTGNYSAATNTGNYSAATNTGNYSAATNTGDRSAATNTGDRSAAKVEGKESIAIVTGIDSRACGALGCWIVLTERGDWNGETYPIKEVKAVRVDGKTIKPNIWYKLKDGQIIETE
nr:MAG TPA: hypothetical protein [Caudoviricetes sp.]